MFVVESDFDCASIECHHAGDATVRVKDIGVVAEFVRIESALPRWHAFTVSLGTINTPFTNEGGATELPAEEEHPTDRLAQGLRDWHSQRPRHHPDPDHNDRNARGADRYPDTAGCQPTIDAASATQNRTSAQTPSVNESSLVSAIVATIGHPSAARSWHQKNHHTTQQLPRRFSGGKYLLDPRWSLTGRS